MSRQFAPPSFSGLPVHDARDLVIKVKYGGTLKRFNACVNGSQFDYNLAALRSKIANAFKFSPNDEFVLTYTDDDGDIVMLDDDDDLCDAAIGQKLNPLRIDVKLNSSSAGAKHKASDSRSMMSAVEEQLAQLKSAIDVQLNSSSARAKQKASDSRSLMSAVEEQLAQLKSVVEEQLAQLKSAIDVQLNSSSAGARQQASDSRSPMSVIEEKLAQVKSAIDEAVNFVPEQVPAVLAKLSAPQFAELLDRSAKLITPRSSVQPTSGLMDSSSGSSSDHLHHMIELLTKSRLSQSATVSGSHSSDMQSSKALGLKSVLAEETQSQVGQAPGYPSIDNPSDLGSSGGKLIYPRKKRTDAQSKGRSQAQIIRGKSVLSSSVPPAPDTSWLIHGVPAPGSGTGTEYERNMYMPFGESYERTNGDSRSAAPPARGPQYCRIPTLESNGKVNNNLHSMHCPAPTVESNGRINGEHSIFPPPRSPVYGPGTSPGSNETMNDLLYGPGTSPGFNGKINGGLPTTFPPASAYHYDPSKFSMHPYGYYQDLLGSYGFASRAYGSIPQPAAHKWIECDGCGVTPIVGPRYKSIVEAEYTRIDKPMLVSERLRGVDKNLRLQLDCRFIKDLTVPDGTAMAPSTPFRKIWCMRNSGSTAWPFGTQLTWVGGDQFARQSSVKLAVPEFGFPVGGEIDVCVDFVAPAKPGRYISYWRLTSPDLVKFGQRVWVLIQVEQPAQTSGKNGTAEINLNLPADGNPTTSKPFMAEQPIQRSGSKQTVGINLNLPAEGITATWTDSASDTDNDDGDRIAYSDAFGALSSQQCKGSKAVGSVTPCAPTPIAVEPIQVSITDPNTTSAGAIAMSANVPASESAPLPEPISVPAPSPAATLVNSHATPVSVPAAPSPDEIFTDMEEKLLRELAEMGFGQADLNKEVLRQNEYDLQKSIDDLCGFHEWDPLLAELKELGFNDDTDIKEVLGMDAEGSIMKRVAMNLLSREKDQ